MTPLWLAILLQLIGAAIIITDVVVPSGGILSLLAAALIGYSIYHVFTEISLQAGYTLVAVDLVALPIIILAGLKLLAKSPATLRTELSSSSGFTSQSMEKEAYLGKKGVAVTDLRPSGVAVIDGKRLDVVSRGEYISRDAEVIVTSVSGNRIVVVELD